jgi:hypothetical protein
MSDFAADDYAEIGRRLRELKEEAGAVEPCKTCDGGGWVHSGLHVAGAPLMEACPDCRNPNGVPQP